MRFILLILLNFNSLAAFVYITDEVDIPIRSDKTFDDNIIRSVPSGTKLDILQINNDGWTKIKFETTIGWVISRYLTNNPPAKHELAKLKNTNNANRTLVKQQQIKIKNLEQQFTDLQQTSKHNTIEILKARSEKKHIEKTYQNTLQLEHENTNLKQQNLNLKTEIKLLKIADEVVIEHSNRTWFLYGGFVLFLGVGVGFMISRNRRR